MDGESLTSDEESIAPTPRSPVVPAAAAQRTADWAASSSSPTRIPVPTLAAAPAKTAVPTSPTRSHRKTPSNAKLASKDAATTTSKAAGTGKGIIRFRKVVRKVMQMHTVSKGISGEPGVDVRRKGTARLYQHLREECDIEVIDYNQTTADSHSYNNREFVQWLNSPDFERKPWSKVRWINISGISWDVVSELGLKYRMPSCCYKPIARSNLDYSTSSIGSRRFAQQQKVSPFKG
jgi:hypothetical protein